MLFLAALLITVTYAAWFWMIGGVLAEWSASRALVYLAGSVTALLWSVAVALIVRGPQGDRPTPGQERVRARRFVILASIAVILSGAVLLETRRSIPQTTFAAIFGGILTPAPYVMFHTKPNLHIETLHDDFSRTGEPGRINVNSQGFRGPEWPTEADPRQLRIAVFGGSSVFHGLTDERTIPALVAGALEARLGRPVVPINAGIAAANSTQELVLLQTQIVDLRPDIIVVLDGFNDLYGPLMYDTRVGYPFNFQVMERAWESHTSTENLFVRLLKSSRLVGRITEILRGAPDRSVDGLVLGIPRDDASIDATASQAAQLHARNWKKIAQICRSIGADCLLALQPTKYHPRHRAPGSSEDAESRAYRLFFEQREPAIQRGEPRVAGVAVTSFADFFVGYDVDAFLDTVHIYDDANVRLADSIVETLCRTASQLKGRC